MTTEQNTELKELKNFISDRFDKVDSRLEKLTEKVDSIDKRLVAVETKVDLMEKRLNTVEGNLPNISEKFGELKNWRQIAFIIIAAVVGWFARSAKF